MESSGRFGKSGSGRPGQMFSSRRGSVLVALIAALIAGLLIYLFVSHYNKKTTPTVAANPTSETVFVAKRYIAAGTPEAQVIAQNLLKTETVPSTSVIAGAITDPSQIADEVASSSIAAGQQITSTDFTHTNVSLAAYLTGGFRAVGLTIDVVHGLTAYISEGSKIDVVAVGNGGSEELFNNVTILANNTTGGYVVLRLKQKQVLDLTNAEHENETIWFTLRPLTGATDPVPPFYVAKVAS